MINQIIALHLVTQYGISWGFKEMWKKLTSQLPNFAWLRQLFTAFITLGLLILLTCSLLQCSLWCSLVDNPEQGRMEKK